MSSEATGARKEGVRGAGGAAWEQGSPGIPGDLEQVPSPPGTRAVASLTKGGGWVTAKGWELGGRSRPQRSAKPQFPQLPPHVISKGTSGSERKQATTRQPRLGALPVDRRPRGAEGGAGGKGPELPRGARGWRRGVASAGPGPLPGREGGGGGAKGKAARAPPARLLPWPGPAAPRWPRPVPPPAPRACPAAWGPCAGSGASRAPAPPARPAATRTGVPLGKWLWVHRPAGGRRPCGLSAQSA